MKLLIPVLMALSFSVSASDIYKASKHSLACIKLENTRLVMDTILHNSTENAVVLIDHMKESGDCYSITQGALFRLVDISGDYYQGAWLPNTSIRLWFHRVSLEQ